MQKKKPNFYISYIKGVALLNIALIHLIDWSNTPLSLGPRLIKEFFYTGILLFTLTTGSVLVIAYAERSSFIQTSKRLMYRGVQLLFFYYLYSITKLFIFNFGTQPFYDQFRNAGTLTISGILSFRSFSVPLTILITYSFLLALAPLFLYINKKWQYPKKSIALIIIGLFVIDYTTSLSATTSPIIKFLYANGFVLLPIALWLIPFLLGFFLAQVGFEKQRKTILISSGVLTLFYGASLYLHHKSLFPSDYQFPLAPYFIASSLFIMSLLLYMFYYLERHHSTHIKKVLATLRFLGDNSLYLYLYHWIVIDLTLWFFSPRIWLIWLTIPIFFALYLFVRRKKLAEYYTHQENIGQDFAVEVS